MVSLRRLHDSLSEFLQPQWFLVGLGLALVGGGFVFASQALVVYSREFFIEISIYVFSQVTGWVLLIEWVRGRGRIE